jgi:2-polyprenyl-3-methyl-5-hydroxy-6-metoxy-1,4-benzoquinol methylase
MSFYGTKSSKYAKDCYVPIKHYNNIKSNITLGANTSAILLSDPKLILFTLSKYKFAGKHINKSDIVLEIGCMDGFASLLLSSFCKELIAVDFYQSHIQDAKKYICEHVENIEFKGLDFLESEFDLEFDFCVSFDVLEHIDPKQSDLFIDKVFAALKHDGSAIIGVPSLNAQRYTSNVNKNSHINCKSRQSRLCELRKKFKKVYVYSMNDEVVHTGYFEMAQYEIYLCIK